MKEILDSLSLESGALVVAVLSALISIGLSRIKPKKIKWLTSVTVPFLIANVVYWLPVMLGADSPEYGTWASIFIFPWYVAGALASILVVLMLSKRQGNEDRNKGRA